VNSTARGMIVKGTTLTEDVVLAWWQLAHAFAYSIKHRWFYAMSEGEAVSSAFAGILRALEKDLNIPRGATYKWAIGAILKERDFFLCGRKKGGIPAHQNYDDLVDAAVDDDQLLHAENAERLNKALSRIKLLPPKHREIVWLSILGYQNKDIAERLGWTPESVSSNRAAARRRLRALMAGKIIRRTRIKGSERRMTIIEELPSGKQAQSEARAELRMLRNSMEKIDTEVTNEQDS